MSTSNDHTHCNCDHSSHKHSGSHYKKNFEGKRSRGWGMGLYRNDHDAKVAGVCSGIAEYVEMDKGLLRIITLASVLFTSGGSAILYGVLWLALATKPVNEQSNEPAPQTQENVQSEDTVD